MGMRRRLRSYARAYLRNEARCRPSVSKVPSEWYGSAYGGFFVSPPHVPDGAIVYSFGVGEDISFDVAMMWRHHAKVFGFDPTPKSIAWVESELRAKDFHFSPFGLHTETGWVEFDLPENPANVSGSVSQIENPRLTGDSVMVEMRSFADTVALFDHTHIDVLKIDIEGSEFLVMPDVLASPVLVDQLLLEVHGRYFRNGRQMTDELVSSIRDAGYELFGVGESLEELSFIRRDLLPS